MLCAENHHVVPKSAKFCPFCGSSNLIAGPVREQGKAGGELSPQGLRTELQRQYDEMLTMTPKKRQAAEVVFLGTICVGLQRGFDLGMSVSQAQEATRAIMTGAAAMSPAFIERLTEKGWLTGGS